MAYLAKDDNWDEIEKMFDDAYASPISTASPVAVDELAFQSWYSDRAQKFLFMKIPKTIH